MNPEDKHEDGIQKVLALKRHEQPPPEFFKGFSHRVLDRIQSEPPPKPTWRQRLSVEFYGVPLYVSLAGVTVCGLLVAGLISSLRVDPPEAAPTESGAAGPLVTEQPTHAIVPPRHQISLDQAPAGTGEGTKKGEGLELEPVRATLNRGAVGGNRQ